MKKKHDDQVSLRYLFQNIGGHQTLNKGVEIFYEKLIHDQRISHFFMYNMTREQFKLYKAENKAYLAHILGVFPAYKGNFLGQANNIADKITPRMTKEHVKIINKHLYDTLKELGLPVSQIDKIMEVLTKSKDEILGYTPHNTDLF